MFCEFFFSVDEVVDEGIVIGCGRYYCGFWGIGCMFMNNGKWLGLGVVWIVWRFVDCDVDRDEVEWWV